MSSTINAMLDAGAIPPEDDGRDEDSVVTPPQPTAADLPEGEYAIAEIMGHSTMIGRFAEVERFGTKMLQIEPIWESKLLPGVFVGGASLYRFTPCTREVAFLRQPKARYQLPDAVRATLPPEIAPALPAPSHDYQFESELDDEPEYGETDEI